MEKWKIKNSESLVKPTTQSPYRSHHHHHDAKIPLSLLPIGVYGYILLWPAVSSFTTTGTTEINKKSLQHFAKHIVCINETEIEQHQVQKNE